MSNWNGKIKCVNDYSFPFYTTGKVYNVKNGVITFDGGVKSKVWKDFKDFCEHSTAGWEEVENTSYLVNVIIDLRKPEEMKAMIDEMVKKNSVHEWTHDEIEEARKMLGEFASYILQDYDKIIFERKGDKMALFVGTFESTAELGANEMWNDTIMKFRAAKSFVQEVGTHGNED